MRGAFTAGVILALGQNLGIENFDLLLGSSSSAPTLTYYLTHQYQAIKDIWQHELGTPRFIKKGNLFKGEPIFNIDYLVDEILGRKYPLDADKLNQASRRLLIGLYNYKADKLAYFSNQSNEVKLDIFQALKATMTIHRNDLEKQVAPQQYVDPELINFINYEKARELGVTHFLVIYNNDHFHRTLGKWLGLQLFKIFQAKKFPLEIKQKLNHYCQLMAEGEGQFREFCRKYPVLLISPSYRTAIHPIMTSNEKISQALDLGSKSADQAKGHSLIGVFQQRSKELS